PAATERIFDLGDLEGAQDRTQPLRYFHCFAFPSGVEHTFRPAASPSGRVKGRRKPGEASPLTRMTGMRLRGFLLSFLSSPFLMPPGVRPVVSGRGQPQPVTAGVVGKVSQPFSKHGPLRIGIGRGNDLSAGTNSECAQRLGGCG